MEKYFEVVDRNRRLHKTVCLYAGVPVYVQCNDPTGKAGLNDDEVFITPLGEMSGYNKVYVAERVKYTDDAFEARAFPLGYISHSGGATYIGRLPTQQQRQGLHADIIVRQGGDLLPSHWFLSKEMSDCITGKHSTFEQALLHVKSAGISRSFDRFWAIAPHHKSVLSLQFRGRPAGLISDDGKITLFKGKEDRLLRQLLTEKGLKINEQGSDYCRNTRASSTH
jgi:hypothetical protein